MNFQSSKAQEFRQRRLEKELQGFPCAFSCYQDPLTQCITSVIWRTPHGRHVEMNFPIEYPFKPPIVYYNYQLLQHMSMDPEMEKEYWTRFQECPCACCFSFVGSRWSPCISLDRVVNELMERDEKWFLVHLLRTERLLRQVLPSDVEYRIAEFL